MRKSSARPDGVPGALFIFLAWLNHGDPSNRSQLMRFILAMVILGAGIGWYQLKIKALSKRGREA
jgi:hypothetical protein